MRIFEGCLKNESYATDEGLAGHIARADKPEDLGQAQLVERIAKGSAEELRRSPEGTFAGGNVHAHAAAVVVVIQDAHIELPSMTPHPYPHTIRRHRNTEPTGYEGPDQIGFVPDDLPHITP